MGEDKQTGGVIDRFRKLEKIRKRYDEYTSTGGPGYKAFMYNAHADVGALLDRVDALEHRLKNILSHVGGQDEPGCYGAYLEARAALEGF